MTGLDIATSLQRAMIAYKLHVVWQTDLETAARWLALLATNLERCAFAAVDIDNY